MNFDTELKTSRHDLNAAINVIKIVNNLLQSGYKFDDEDAEEIKKRLKIAKSILAKENIKLEER